MNALVLALLLAASPALDSSREAYQSGDLARAQSGLEALLYPLQLQDLASEAEARMLLAATYHAQEDMERAEREAVQALAADPGARLDPLLYPPDFIAFIERVRALHRQRITELAAQRRPPVLLPSPPPPTVSRVLPPPRTASPGWYLVPFGVGHFAHGRRAKGTVLAVTQGTTFAVSAVSLGTAWALRGPDGKYAAADAGTARALNVSYLVGAYAFAALYAYGVLDGLLTAEPSVRAAAPESP